MVSGWISDGKIGEYTYFGESILQGGDGCEDFGHTDENIRASDDPDIEGCRAVEFIDFASCGFTIVAR